MNRSVWSESVSLPEFKSIDSDTQTDVLIIGGGLAGILTAFLLEKEGVKYILAEKDRICNGTTCNTTGKITFQHGLIYDSITERMGTDAARAYLYANKEAFDTLSELCRGCDCDYEQKDSYVYSTDNRYSLEREIKALENIGFSAEFCENTELPIKIVGAVKFPKQAQFNPLKFVTEKAKNLNIYEHTHIKQIIGTTAITEKAKIKAQRIIVTTHFPFINRYGAYFLKLYQHRSYVIAVENAAKLDGMYVDNAKNGMSFRNYKDLLLIGGGDHRTGKTGGCWQELREFAESRYKGSREKYHWAAQDCMSLDDVPYIGNYAFNTPRLFVASGFNKWGMTGSMLAAMLLRDKILGRKNEYAEFFNPSRKILHPQLFVNGFEAVTNLVNFKKKRCPHMGCALKWNSVEHTWDCTCHGSRFTQKGNLLENPANKDMK